MPVTSSMHCSSLPVHEPISAPKQKPLPSLLVGRDWVYRASAALPIGEKKVAMGMISVTLKASTTSGQT